MSYSRSSPEYDSVDCNGRDVTLSWRWWAFLFSPLWDRSTTKRRPRCHNTTLNRKRLKRPGRKPTRNRIYITRTGIYLDKLPMPICPLSEFHCPLPLQRSIVDVSCFVWPETFPGPDHIPSKKHAWTRLLQKKCRSVWRMDLAGGAPVPRSLIWCIRCADINRMEKLPVCRYTRAVAVLMSGVWGKYMRHRIVE